MINLPAVVAELHGVEEWQLHWLSVHTSFDESTPESYIEEWIKRVRSDLVLEAFYGRRTMITEPEVLREKGGGGTGIRIRALTMPLVGE